MLNPQSHFSAETIRWFQHAFYKPTAVQEQAWPAISTGAHTLLSAPTGTGKTLAAFLVFIDRLYTMAENGSLQSELYLIYVSPLKSLAADIRENLRRPLLGIQQETRATSGLDDPLSPVIQTAVRTGDTPVRERRAMVKRPPHILITTPESLYLLLTSQSGKNILKTARWIIVDELHAMIDSKRGAHLMLSLARLDKLCPQPLQRVGLSASIAPLDVAAAYLSPDPVRIVAPAMQKKKELTVHMPAPLSGTPQKDPVWQAIAVAVLAHCSDTRSVIAFVEGRAHAEKLAYLVNQIVGEGYAWTHHGSLAKEQRLNVENALRQGKLRLLCATSSMELGIDVGDIDKVFQIGCPHTLSSTLQRLGRAGHNPGRVSMMRFFPRTALEALFCALTAAAVQQGTIETCHPPNLCLDVLAQHLVSMACGASYQLDEVMPLLQRAYPFRAVTRDDVHAVLCMLAGDFEHARDKPARPRLLYDRINGFIQGDAYSRMLAVSAGGTIPDKGLYAVKTENGVRLGELDEAYVFEARIGDRFMLGSFAWRIKAIGKDHVVVTPSAPGGARPPFWKGDVQGRKPATGLAFGRWLRQLVQDQQNGTLRSSLVRLGLDESGVDAVEHLMESQIMSMGGFPDDQTILVEHFRDEQDRQQVMIHTLFGQPVNEPLAVLLVEQARQQTGQFISYVADDDGILLYPFDNIDLPAGLLQQLSAASAQAQLTAKVTTTPLFNMAFRYNASRALMMGVRQAGRQPLWVQRLRGTEMLDMLSSQKDHPLIRETTRECLEDYWNLPGVINLLHSIQDGSMHVLEKHPRGPSPLSARLFMRFEAAMMYQYAPTTPAIQQSDASKTTEQGIKPDANQLAAAAARKQLPKDAGSLHNLLMIEGDLQAGELTVPPAWIDILSRENRVRYIEPGLWIATEQDVLYKQALLAGDSDARQQLIRRLLRYRGGHTAMQVAGRYGWAAEETRLLLNTLEDQKEVIRQDDVFHHAVIYKNARRTALRLLRSQIQTRPPECYAALLVAGIRKMLSGEHKPESVLQALSDRPFTAELWESTLLPFRLPGYRPEQLDELLSEGIFFWQLSPDKKLSFHLYEQIDWQADLSGAAEALTGLEKTVYNTLLKRGSSSLRQLADLADHTVVFDLLLHLMEKGLVYADSFMPVRAWLSSANTEQLPPAQRARLRSRAMSSGRWSVVYPLRTTDIEQKLEQAFARVIVVCRATYPGDSWDEAMEVLRTQEYTGQARRGYFIAGLPGLQYMRESDVAFLQQLQQTGRGIIWLPAVDPAQPWGKSLTHSQDRSFLIVPGTAVALQEGRPIAVLERQGQQLRVFDQDCLVDALRALTVQFKEKRIFPLLNRLSVKNFPSESVGALSDAGFVRNVQNFVFYRPYDSI